MIGRYYDSWGSKHQILFRYGDNRGNPFPGPIQVCYLENNRFFVLGKNQMISLQNTIGAIEFHLCPSHEQQNLEAQLVEAEINDDDWQMKFLANEMNEVNQDRIKTATIYADMQPISIASIMNHDILYIADQRNQIKSFNVHTREIVNTFGKSGFGSGEFSGLSCITAFKLGPKPYVIVGDSGSNQKVHFFSGDGEFMGSVGGKGPMLGQFRDIPSVAVHLPENLSDHTIEYHKREYQPSWFRGRGIAEDEIFDFLVSDHQVNNFAINQDWKDKTLYFVYYINYDKQIVKLPIRYGTVTVKSAHHRFQAPEPIPKLSKTPSIFKEKRGRKLGKTKQQEEEQAKLAAEEEEKQKQYEEESTVKTGYYLIEPERHDDGGEKTIRVYDSLYDLVKYRKDLFILKEEIRDFFQVAVVDRKNFRVQICHCYFTKSAIYSPLICPKFEIGGIKNRSCQLGDPVAVSYTKGGELAICDNGKCQVVLLTPDIYDVIKVIQTTFLSTRELQLELQNKKDEESTTSDKGEGIGKYGAEGYWDPTSSKANNSQSESPSDKSARKLSSKKKFALTPLELENSKRPCTVAFNENGNMALGFKSGGIYVYQKNVNSPMGLFEKLETKMMDKIVLDYLQYSDIEILRNTCVYLHNYTRELRLSYRIFPLPRQRFYNKIIYLFLKWARIGREGLPQLSNYEIKDKYNQLVCPYHLQLLCPLKEEACNYSHKQIFLNRKEINLTKAYILYDELIFFIGDIFNPKFIWKYEIYIKELFLAYSHEEPVLIRKGTLSRPGETIREKYPSIQRVLNFTSYLEVIVVLEEHLDGLKSIVDHKLFRSTGMKRFLPKVPTNLESLELKVPYVNPYQQYQREGINVPPNRHLTGKRIISKKGYEDAERKAADEKKEHVEVFHYHTERAASLVDKLFS